ncbi:MAG: alpha/beta hydrolase, partial [Acidimicrobiia bacterium]
MTSDPAHPDPFHPGAVDHETATFNAELEARLAEYPPLTSTTPAAAREARELGESWAGPLVLSDRAVERMLPGPAGQIRARIFLPQSPRGVYLHIHGGGWVLGAAHHQDLRLEALADRCRVAVMSVEYRLAPEHPYPAGPDDCEAAAAWLAEHAPGEFGTDLLLIGGESAGAHLAVVTLLRMRDRYQFTGFLGANLVYGAYDLRLTPSARAWGGRNLVLSTPIME